MKLSEIKGPRAVDAIAELIQPIANIAGDRENVGRLFNVKPEEGETQGEAALRMVKNNVPLLLKTHNTDILQILSIINDEDPDEISIPGAVKGVLDLLGDDDFMALFMYAVPKEARQQPTKSSEAAVISEPE